jgi:hypothetical protein
MPSRSICDFSRLQYPHQVVVNIVTVPGAGSVGPAGSAADIGAPDRIGDSLQVNAQAAALLPGPSAGCRDRASSTGRPVAAGDVTAAT